MTNLVCTYIQVWWIGYYFSPFHYTKSCNENFHNFTVGNGKKRKQNKCM